MSNTDNTPSTLTVDEAEQMRAAMLNLPNVPSEQDDWSRQQAAEAKSSFIRLISISIDPTQTGYDFAIETVEFRYRGFFRYLGFSSFTKWCKRYNFSPRTIAKYLKTYYELSEDRSVFLEVYQHLSPWKIEKLVKPILADEPKQANPSSSPEELTDWLEWKWDLESRLETAK
ncbi:MAG: hypothetical protein IIA59_04275 [Candidatus Marinimicrobia bacterium]|nr:hypothetical protein [Candidatus Neomarinimicrobiota bacterium]